MSESRYASRKFIVTLVAMLIAAGLRWMSVMDNESTMKILITAILGYQAGNVGAKFADKPKEPT